MKKIIILLFAVLINTQINAQCWQSISSGENHTVAIKNDGSLWAWGDNTYGQLGTGTLNSSYTPIQIGTAKDWNLIATGKNHTAAIKADGSLWTWGNNNLAQLGDGTFGSGTEKNIPTQIGIATDWKYIYTGDDYTIAIKTNNTLWVWGDNFFGQLGDGTNSTKFSPTQVGTGTDWKTISTESSHTIAIKNNGTLWTWGKNENGQLGDGTIGSSTGKNIPIQIGTDTDWQSVAGGGYHSIALKTNGSLWSWGYNYYGQLGIPNNQITPNQVGSENNWKSIAAGLVHTLAIKMDGTLWACGLNDKGQFGNGTNNNSSMLLQIDTGTDWEFVDAKRHTTIALKTDSTLWSWGANNAGQIGDNTVENKIIPTAVSCNSLASKKFNLEKSKFYLYPNPTSGILYLQNTTNQPINNIIVADLLGKTVLEQTENTFQINTLQLQKGMYFLSVISDSEIYSYKFIKN